MIMMPLLRTLVIAAPHRGHEGFWHPHRAFAQSYDVRLACILNGWEKRQQDFQQRKLVKYLTMGDRLQVQGDLGET